MIYHEPDTIRLFIALDGSLHVELPIKQRLLMETGAATMPITEKDGDYPIMQWTGLVDRDGTEIYEGDIVESYFSHHNPVPVIYDVDVAGWEPFLKWADGPCSGGSFWTIVGNVYANPELVPAS